MTSPMQDLPEHMMIPTDETGSGPCTDIDAPADACWCGCPHSLTPRAKP